MTTDTLRFHEHLRASTIQLLGYADADRLTAAQEIRVDRAVMLRLVIDDLQARQMRGEAIDVHAFVSASEDLERMVGGNPASPPPTETTRFGPNARERLRRLIETTLQANDVAEAERLRDVREREEMAAALAAGAFVAAAAPAPAAPTPVASLPSEPPANVVSLHYLREGQREPRRDFHDGRAPTGPHPWPLR